MSLPIAPYVQINIPPYNSVQPTIWNMEYQGNGEWFAFLNYSFSGNQGIGQYPLVYSNQRGFLFFTNVGNAANTSLSIQSDSYISGLKLLEINSIGNGSNYNFGWYKTDALDVMNAPYIVTGSNAAGVNINNFVSNNCIAYNGEFGIDSVNLSTLIKTEYSVSYLQAWNPSFIPFGSGIALANTSNQMIYISDISHINTIKILKSYSTIQGFNRLGSNGFVIYWQDSALNNWYDLYINPLWIIEKLPMPANLFNPNSLGNGYIITSNHVYDMIMNEQIGQIDTTILPSSASYFLLYDGVFNAYEGANGGHSFWLYTLPPLPPLLPFQFNLQTHFAHNYSRGIPVQGGLHGLILPPNTNTIL